MRLLFFIFTFLAAPVLATAQEVWRVAYEQFPPYTFYSETGQVEGYAADLVRALASQRGIEVEFVRMDNPGEIVAALGEGTVDLSAALAKTAAREESAIFSVPHQSVRIWLYAPAETAGDVESRWPHGVRVGFIEGAYPSVVASRYPSAEQHAASTSSEVLFNLLNGDIEAAIYPDIGFRRLVEALDTRREFVTVGEKLDEVPLHLAISKTRPVLAATLNSDLSSFIVTDKYSQIVNRWFGPRVTQAWSTTTVMFLVAAVGGIVATFGVAAHLHQRRKSQLIAIAFAEEKAEVVQRAAEQLRSRNNRLEKKMSELEELLYVVSHDLSSPLVSISGFARNARRAIDAEDAEHAAELLERVETNVKGMSKLINGVLSVSRIGQETTHSEDFLLSSVVDDIRVRLDGLLDAHFTTLHCDQDVTLTTDPHLFGRALQNLIENAIKYGCPHESNAVRILVDQGPDRLRIGVSDSGPGIPEHLQSRIFQMYRRLQNDSSGSGLGLSIVSKIADRLDASVYVDNSTEKGALFWIDFDIADSTHRKQAA